MFIIGSTPLRVFADTSSGLTISPVVIDEKGKARDIINESITLTNNTAYNMVLYPSINDVNNESGMQTFQYAQDSSGLKNSLSNWVELSRGTIEISPGEQKVVPFTITINENAIANTYHAVIAFGEGNTRDQAEAAPPLGTVTVNLEVQADIKESLQLAKFTTDNVVFTGDDVLFNYQLENIGNQDLDPTGEIDIYDRNGQQVASVDVNKEGKTISPNQISQLASVWNGANGFGRFKALLTVNYGTQAATVQDTVFFWVVPWKQILELLGVSMIALVILGLYFNRWFETRHLGKLAAAGALRPEVLAQMQSAPPPPLVKLPPVPQLPPVGEIAERVQAQVEHKRKVFSLFKRQGFVTIPEPLSKSVVEQVPSPVPLQTRSGTIDLKNIRPPVEGSARPESHVINLKKHI